MLKNVGNGPAADERRLRKLRLSSSAKSASDISG
jgi:hypothetical protein